MTLMRRIAPLGGAGLMAPVLAAPGSRAVCFVHGYGAASVLTDERYQTILGGVFKSDSVTVDFLTRRFAMQREAKSEGATVDQGNLIRTQQQDINAGKGFDILGNADPRANQV
ncbi:MAG: hypothetical protein KF889_10660 [Alphaproteobacteria bacterium]|nr:hypothetical protein [Alphaproteobacteria bacterium]MCW5741285.1 hypothetical protein [Alphaproteobacteria bacterium]